MEDPLVELRKLTENVPSLSVVTESHIMWENVIVERGFMSKGSEFKDAKRYGLHEYFHVIEGKLTFKLEQKNRTLLEADHIHILPNEPYWVYASRDTRYIYVAFPPNGGNNATKT